MKQDELGIIEKVAKEFLGIMEKEVVELSRQNAILRKLLWLRNGCPHSSLLC